jgi:hypothetical protein
MPIVVNLAADIMQDSLLRGARLLSGTPARPSSHQDSRAARAMAGAVPCI